MISVKDLVVRFNPGLPAAVRGVGFEVAEGEAFGLVGESGCGKSTVLRALAGLNRDYEGEIAIQGQVVNHQRSKDFFRRVQMVFQDPYGSLHPRKTVKSQLLEPLRNQGLPRNDAAVEEALSAVGLDPRLSYRYPHQLSGGQRQRVAIARALILSPDVLLLDEPTSALDVSVQAEVLNLLSDLRRTRNLTYVLVSHDLAVVAHMCDTVAVMQAGRIVEIVDAAALRQRRLEHPYSRQLLEASSTYGKAGV